MKTVSKTQKVPKNLLVTLVLAMVLAYSCTSKPNSLSDARDSGKTKSAADSDGNAVPTNPNGMMLARGMVISVSSNKITIKTKDSVQAITLSDTLHLFDAFSGSIADVKNTIFIGVTTQKQADGSDRATEIHIFPEELRGLGEGSFIMDAGAPASRMTNGAASQMTNGTASRMSNGRVQKADGSSLVIQYQGKSRTVNVPANTPITVYKLTNKKLSAGVKVVALVKKDASGNYSTAKILISRK